MQAPTIFCACDCSENINKNPCNPEMRECSFTLKYNYAHIQFRLIKNNNNINTQIQFHLQPIKFADKHFEVYNLFFQYNFYCIRLQITNLNIYTYRENVEFVFFFLCFFFYFHRIHGCDNYAVNLFTELDKASTFIISSNGINEYWISIKILICKKKSTHTHKQFQLKLIFRNFNSMA